MGQAAQRYQFLVESGLHAGVADTLAAGRYSIGRALDADIVLADRGMAPVHGSIEFKENAVRVSAVEAPVMVSVGTGEAITLLPGSDRDLALPAFITLGDTKLRVDPVATGKSGIRPVPLLLGAAIPILLYAAISFGLPSSHPPMAPRAAVTALASPDTTEQAAQALETRLAAAGLGQAVQVSISGSSLMARGSIDPSRSADWLSVETWYDEALASRTPLVRQVAVAGTPTGPAMAISGIWTGANPHVVARNGEKFGVGAIIDGGWKILEIDAGRVLLERDGRTLALTY